MLWKKKVASRAGRPASLLATNKAGTLSNKSIAALSYLGYYELMKAQVRAALFEDYTEPVRDPLWGHIYLTPALAKITSSSPFTRLHRITQLGPVFLVYPGATHTRASHSIGVYNLARRLLLHLAEDGACEWLTPEGVKSFLCAALLHDLGHFPYTHSLKELPLREHEALTADLIEREPVKSLVTSSGGDPAMTAAIVDEGKSGDSVELRFYRKLLSGTLDPDKLDYLSRDARYCGVPYGVQDVDFILSRLHPHSERGIDIDSRGITGVESLLFSKYLMYRAVYWHKDVRAATSMVKKALLTGLESLAITENELYNLDDEGLFALAEKSSCPSFSLIESVRNGCLFTEAAEIPLCEINSGRMFPLAERSGMEESLAREYSSVFGKNFGKDDLVIDIPEPVSFETDLFVNDENCLFSSGASALNDSVIDSFVSSLRIVRVFVGNGFEAKVKTSRERLLKITQNWLHLYKGSK